MAKHALLSPSKFESLMLCPGKLAMEADEPDKSSSFADEGTAAHFLASECLFNNQAPAEHIGRQIIVTEEHVGWPLDGVSYPLSVCFEVDADMAAFIQRYIQAVCDIAGDKGEILVEQQLPIDHITGEEDAVGTSDAVILLDDELVVVDLKYGRGVEVSAEDNVQLKMYGLGAIEEYCLMGDFKRVRLVIVQPRVADGTSEWTISVEDLAAWAHDAKNAAIAARMALEFRSNWINGPDYSYLTPGDKQCKFCRAKATCPKLSEYVQEKVAAEFSEITITDAPLPVPQDGDDLADKMAACDLIEEWIKAIRAKVESQLLAGHDVPGFKLVEGKRGPRKWADAKEAESMLKAMRLKVEEMYDLTLISPTSADKLHKAGTIGPRQWPKLQQLVTQSDGKPHVAPESDKRPALRMKPVADEFDVINPQAADAVA